jgi:hypothetical protein
MCPGISDVNPLRNVEGIIDRSACPERYLLFGHTCRSCARHVLDICGIDRITPSDPKGIIVLSLAHGYHQVCLALGAN